MDYLFLKSVVFLVDAERESAEKLRKTSMESLLNYKSTQMNRVEFHRWFVF